MGRSGGGAAEFTISIISIIGSRIEDYHKPTFAVKQRIIINHFPILE